MKESSVAMYLVELRPGKEELYRTTEELAAAIRKGDVDGHSRIYHRATSKWISVTLHPQYKAIVAERPASPSLPPLERTNWTFFNDSADSLAGANDPSPEDDAGRDEDNGQGSDPNHPWRRPLALSITGGLLILGLQLAASGPKPPWAAHAATTPAEATIPALPAAAPAVPADEAPAPTPAAAPAPAALTPTISLVSSGASWTELNRGYVSSAASDTPAETAVAETPAPPAPALPAAPRIRTKGMLLSAVSAPATSAVPIATSKSAAAGATAAAAKAAASINGFMSRWAAAHDSALSRLASGVRVARLNQLFASSRLSPGGGVTETRMSLAGLANFIRIYREQQTAIERRFQDAFTTTAKTRNWAAADVRQWYAKPARTDAPDVAALTSSLVTGIDSLFGVLDAQAGTYAVTRNTIRFEDPSAAREYMALRERIVVTIDSARVMGGADHPGPMSYLLQAIGSTRLPIAS
jgi:hypothetical protein